MANWLYKVDRCAIWREDTSYVVCHALTVFLSRREAAQVSFPVTTDRKC